MAKQSGIGFTCSLDDSGAVLRDISNDVTNLSFTMPHNMQDVTGLDKSAVERILLLADFTATLNGVFNTAANMSHAVLKTVPSSSIQRTLSFAIASQTLSNEVIVSDYQMTRAADGSFTWQAPASLANGTVPAWS